MYSRKEVKYYSDKALLVLVRKLADEMSINSYSNEWYRSPLNRLLPQLFKLLNHHPKKLGDILQKAYGSIHKSGNINQLGYFYPSLFRKYQKQYYLDEYIVFRMPIDKKIMNSKYDVIPVKELHDIAIKIVKILTGLKPEQENEHRTLENICFALYPIYMCGDGSRDKGWYLCEWLGYWRDMPSAEHPEYAKKVLDDFINSGMPRSSSTQY
jgi:hypothetical protein